MSAFPGGLGLVGLGAMGGEMAVRLLDAGNELAIFDTRKEAMEPLAAMGAVASASPAEVADRAETVIVSLPTPDVVAHVVSGDDGLLKGSSIKNYIDVSTTGPSVASEIAAVLKGAGIGYIDAPVSGGPLGAKEGRLTMITAGDPKLFEQLKPVLAVLGSNIFHVGDEPGQGQLAKVLNNLLSGCALAITGEALALGVKGGLDPARLLEILNVSSGRNTATADKYPRCVLTRTFDFGFRLKLMLKDVTLCVQEATRRKSPMVLGAAIQQLWSVADANADEDADCTVIAQMFEQWAGVTIAPSASDGA